MEFLVQNRDPLFSLIIFVGLIFIISFFSYVWAVGRTKKQKESLESFFEKFSFNEHSNIDTLIEQKSSKEALLLLAQAYTNSGDYEKAIAIYLHLRNKFPHRDILLELAKLYKKAGFLARSVAIYEELLRFFPREKRALRELLFVYEKLHRLQDALIVAQILQELGEGEEESAYIQTLIAIEHNEVKKLLSFYQHYPKLVRPVFSYLFEKDYNIGWKYLRVEDYKKIVDLLWYLPKEKIYLDALFLQELYSAKGYVSLVKESAIFELDLLLHYPKADLEFEYVCSHCKKIFPIAFYRCPECAAIGSDEVKMIITQKRSNEENYTF